MKITIIVGTRPEIIKMSPVIRALERYNLEHRTFNIEHFILHTGQHYSYNLDRVFFEQLKLPRVKYNLEVRSGSPAEQTGKILIGVEEILQQESPDVVLVEGDTNSVLASALAAVKLHIKVGHVEAGLRSYDRNMPGSGGSLHPQCALCYPKREHGKTRNPGGGVKHSCRH